MQTLWSFYEYTRNFRSHRVWHLCKPEPAARGHKGLAAHSFFQVTPYFRKNQGGKLSMLYSMLTSHHFLKRHETPLNTFSWKQYKITFFGKMIFQVFSILEDIYIVTAPILLEKSQLSSLFLSNYCLREAARLGILHLLFPEIMTSTKILLISSRMWNKGIPYEHKLTGVHKSISKRELCLDFIISLNYRNRTIPVSQMLTTEMRDPRYYVNNGIVYNKLFYSNNWHMCQPREPFPQTAFFDAKFSKSSFLPS